MIRRPPSSPLFPTTTLSRSGADTRGGLAAAIRQRDRIASSRAAQGIPASGGTWAPYGKGPLHGDDPTYQAAFGDGFGHVNGRDRKSTRLNSSHLVISYAVFC